MKYTNITVDAGAAATYYQVVWNNPIEFKNVIIHVFMEFFGNIGKAVTGSGFEDIIYQAELCTTGGIKGVLSGKHYNRSWMVHECFAEAIDRLFCETFIDIPPDQEEHFQQCLSSDSSNNCDLFKEKTFVDFNNLYKQMKEDCWIGKYGKTPQFWMSYQSAVDQLHKLHYAININDFDLRATLWENAIAYCFSMNKQNYARYGTYYVLQLLNIDKTHPGAKEELKSRGVSVCRNSYNIGQSIDGAGEQTFMKDAKTIGGIKDFATQESTYEKWVLNRSAQAEYVSELLQQAGLKNVSDI